MQVEAAWYGPADMDVARTQIVPFPGRPENSPPDLDVGVIYTGERHWLLPLLESAAGSADGIVPRLVLVDNASGEDLSDFLGFFPETRVVTNVSRLTYAENLNRIIEHSDAPLLLALNTDMSFDPPSQCLSHMVQFMHENPNCGVAGCQVRHPDGSNAFAARRFQSLRIIAARRLGLSRMFGRDLDSYLYNEFDHSESFACEWLSGCFLMLRRAALLETGPFDTDFRKYKEDVDLCLRMAIAGWRVMFCGDTFVYHHEQRASRHIFSRDALIHARSYLHWLRKWGFDPRQHISVDHPETPTHEQNRAA